MSDSVVFIRSMEYFGDQLVTYPMLYQLKALRPNDTVTVVAHDPVQQYYSHLPWVDRFVQAKGWKNKRAAIAPRADLLLALHHSSEQYSLLGLARRARVRAGFRNKRLTDVFWTHSWKKDINEYIGLANLNLLRTVHDFDPVQAARGCIGWIAQGAQHAVQASNVVFMVGGGAGAFKRWGVPNYVALADRLKEVLGNHCTFTFLVGPAEQAEKAALLALGRPDFRLLDSRPLGEIAQLCLNAQLVVANDCGPSHIAQNACVPYVGLFNEPNPEWFWQRANSVSVTPESGVIDIQAISVNQVYGACKQALAAGSL